jgi:hypothetical protein
MDLEYDESSPSGLRWIASNTNRIKVGDVAGSRNPEGYWILTRHGNKAHRAHNIIWELHNGRIPKGMTVDHIDRNPSNNKIENLRLATPSSQCHNRKNWGKYLKWVKRTKYGTFIGRFTLKGKLIEVGSYKTELEAHIEALARRLELYWVI